MQGLLFVAGFILLFFILLYTAFYFMKKRSKKLQEVALQLGFSFKEKGGGSITNDFSNLALFQRGDHSYEENVMTKSNAENTITILDFNYVEEWRDYSASSTSSIRRTSSAHIQTVACFRSAELNLPEFSCNPENFLDRLLEPIGKKLGYIDIDFDLYPEFSRKFRLFGKDKLSVSKLFNNSEIIAFCEKEKGISIQGGGNNLIIYRHMHEVSPEDIPSFLNKAQQIYSMFSH